MASPYQQDPYDAAGQPEDAPASGYPASPEPTGGYPAPPEPASGYPAPYPPAPYSPAGYPPDWSPPGPGGALTALPAPYGVDPVTGQPYSDKSKIAAGLLQLLPGFFLSLGGIGRLYAGHTGIGIAQVCLSVLGWICFWCGLFLFFPLIVPAAAWVWAVVDGIVLLAGRPVDGQGRLLRP